MTSRVPWSPSKLAFGNPTGRRVISVVLWASLLTFAATLSLQSIRSVDYWWHLRTGALIAETGEVPKVDVFTFTVPGTPHLEIHWLFQLGLYALHCLGGHTAVSMAKLVLIFVLVALLARIGHRPDRPAVTVFALGLMLAVACHRFMPRPELPTFVLLAATLALLDRFERRGDAWVYAIVGIQLLWVNFHGLFALGIALCGIHLVGEVLRPLGRPGTRLRAARVRRLAALTVLSILVSIANPNGLDGALYPFKQYPTLSPGASGDESGVIITETFRLFDPRRPIQPLAMGFASALAVLSLAAMVLNSRRLRPSDPLMWGAFLFLLLAGHRNRALFAIVAAPILTRNLNGLLDLRPISQRIHDVAAGLVSILLFVGATSAVRGDFYPRLGIVQQFGIGIDELTTPTGAVEWIERQRPPGPICHPMSVGGNVMWRLYPDYKVMSDARVEVFGSEFTNLQPTTPERFQSLADEFQCGVALVHHSLIPSGDLLWWLNLSRDWMLTFVDDAAAVFVRVPEVGPSRFAKLDLDDPDLFPPLDGTTGNQDMWRRILRTRFYMAMHRFKPALAIWEAALEVYPDIPDGEYRHAALLMIRRRREEAEPILRSLTERNPNDAALLIRVGNLRRAAGRSLEAKALYQKAHDLDPTLPSPLYPDAKIDEAALALRARVEGAVAVILGIGLCGLALYRSRVLERGRETPTS